MHLHYSNRVSARNGTLIFCTTSYLKLLCKSHTQIDIQGADRLLKFVDIVKSRMRRFILDVGVFMPEFSRVNTFDIIKSGTLPHD